MMRLRMVFTLLMAIFCMGELATAKDMNHRFGLGIKNNTSENLPSIGTTYFYSQDLVFTAGIGVDSKKSASKFQLHGGLRKIIFTEPNLNFYTGAQLGVVNYEDPVLGKQSGFELLGVFGTEFFFAGLENLGFTFEGGVGMVSLKDVYFRTLADHPFRAGLVFYF